MCDGKVGGPYHKALFIASASLPLYAIHRSMSSLFSALSFFTVCSDMLSCRFRDRTSSCTSYHICVNIFLHPGIWFGDLHLTALPYPATPHHDPLPFVSGCSSPSWWFLGVSHLIYSSFSVLRGRILWF